MTDVNLAKGHCSCHYNSFTIVEIEIPVEHLKQAAAHILVFFCTNCFLMVDFFKMYFIVFTELISVKCK